MPLDLSFDPLDVPADKEELKEAMERILELPVTSSGGLVYQFDSKDELKMRKAQKGLSVTGGSIPWRQLNNDITDIDADGLGALIQDLEMLQFLRGVVADTEYMAFKLGAGFTRRQIADWESKYANGFIPS